MRAVTSTNYEWHESTLLVLIRNKDEGTYKIDLGEAFVLIKWQEQGKMGSDYA